MTGHDALPATIAGAYVFGMTAALISTIKPSLGSRPGIDEQQASGVSTVFCVSLIPLMVLGGILTDLVGARWVLCAGSLLTGMALFGLSLCRTHVQIVGTLILASAGTAGIGTAVTKLMPIVFFDTSAVASLNLGYVVVGLGGLLTPLVTESFLASIGYTRTLGVAAIIALVPAPVAIITPGAAFSTVSANLADVAQVVSSPILWLAGFVFMLYLVLEGSITGWVASLPVDAGQRQPNVLTLPAFWIALLASRFIVGFVRQYWLSDGVDWWLAGIIAILAAAVLGNMIGAEGRPRLGWGMVTLGLLLGPLLPTLIGIVFGMFGEGLHGTAFGMMFGVAAAGGLLFSPIVGAYMQRRSMQHALRAPLAAALILAAATLVLGVTI